MSIAHIRKYATGPRKEKKPAIAVTVVINTDEPIAGSKFNLSKLISIKAPKRPVIFNFMIMAVVRTAVICNPPNYNQLRILIIKAKATPLKKLTVVSLITNSLALLVVNSRLNKTGNVTVKD